MKNPRWAWKWKAILLLILCLTTSIVGRVEGQFLERELEEAREKVVLKDFEGALRLYDFILEEDPEHIEALNGKGKVLSFLGKYEGAREAYRGVLTIDPGNVEALTGMADTYSWESDNAKAIALLEGEDEKNPGQKEILIRLARYHLKENDRDRALLYAREIMEDDPGDTDAHDIIDKVSVVYQNEAFLGYYFLDINNASDGNNLYGGLRFTPGSSYSLFGRLDFLDRFQESEVRFLGGGTIKFARELELSSEVGIAPDAQIFPILSGWFEIASPSLASWVISGSLNLSHYRDGDLYGITISGEYYPYGYVSVLARGTLSRLEFDRGGGSTDGALFLGATWFIGSVNDIHAYVAYGNKSYKPNTIDLVGDIDAKIIGVGGTYFLKSGWGISPSLEYLDKERDTRYVQVGFEIVRRW